MRKQMGAFSTARRAIAYLAVVAMGLVPGGAVHAQPQFDHTGQIDAVLAQLGGGRDLSKATDRQLGQLWQHFTARGQFFLDLYALDRELLAEFAKQRDSIARAGGASGPGAVYFWARAQHELGQVREAIALYGRVAPSAPLRLRSESEAWAAVANGRGGDTWQQAVTDWRAGKQATLKGCASGAHPICPLVKALVDGDVPGMIRLQREALRRTAPEYADTLKGKTGTFPVEYHDPVSLYVMGVVDNYVAARLLEGHAGFDVFRGVALLRAGRPRQALDLLDGATSTTVPVGVFVGEASALTGNRTAAEQAWRGVTGAANLNWLADSRSIALADGGFAVRRFDEENRQQLRGLRDANAAGPSLGRALVRERQWQKAIDAMRAVRPLSVTPSLSRVPPLIPVVSAFAYYGAGRAERNQSLYMEAVTELQAVATVGGAARTFRLLQAVSVPKSGTGEIR